MKRCPICGKEYESENTCPSCGIILIDTETNSAIKIESEKKGLLGSKKKKEQEAAKTTKPAEGAADPFAVAADPFAAAAGKVPEKTVAEDKTVEKKTEDNAVPDDGAETTEPAGNEAADPFAAAAGAPRNKAAEPTMESSAGSQSNATGNGGAGKNINISFKPVYAVAAVVAVLVIVAIVFMVRGMKAKKEGEEMMRQYQAEVQQQGDGSVQEEIDLSEVDVNTVDESYWKYTAELEDSGASVVLALEEPLTFYAYNMDNEATLLKNVHEVYIDDTKGIDVSGFLGKETTVGGYLTIEGNEVWMEVLDAESDDAEDDTAIHEYRIVISDVSWSQAKAECENAGGYLARINSAEEYQYITNMLTSGGYTKNHFYLGGRRDGNGREYFWVNKDNQFIGDVINASDSWSSGCWFSSEPSFVDTGSGANGQIEENVMNLFYVNGAWYLNDSSDDLAGNYPSLMRGKVGYIIEME